MLCAGRGELRMFECRVQLLIAQLGKHGVRGTTSMCSRDPDARDLTGTSSHFWLRWGGSEAEKILDLDASSTAGPHVINIILIQFGLLWVHAALNLYCLLPKQSHFLTYPSNYDTYLQV